MAGIKDILEIEKQRESKEDWYKMNMFKEGTFLRCYEASAWLCHRFISEYKVTHRHMKGIDQSIAFVGFPVTNLEKITPDGAKLVNVSDKYLTMLLPPPYDEKSVEEFKNDYETWKSLQPLTPGKTETESSSPTAKRSHESTKIIGTKSLFDIARMLVAFPVETHSPIECMNFLIEVKGELAKII